MDDGDVILPRILERFAYRPLLGGELRRGLALELFHRRGASGAGVEPVVGHPALLGRRGRWRRPRLGKEELDGLLDVVRGQARSTNDPGAIDDHISWPELEVVILGGLARIPDLLVEPD